MTSLLGLLFLCWGCFLVDANTTDNTSCLFELSASTNPTIITSPRFPLYVEDNTRCSWMINARPGFQVQLYFLFLDVQPGSDFIQISNVQNTVRPVLLNASTSSSQPHSYVSANNTLILLMDIRRGSEALRFNSFFMEVHPTNPNELEECNYTFEATFESQAIQSPGFPNGYANNLNCVWRLTADPDSFVQLTFQFFETEEGYDFVELSQVQSSFTSLSGSRLPQTTFISSNSSLVVRFTSDSSVVAHGFRALFREFNQTNLFLSQPTSNNSCGFSYNLSTYPVLINTPNYPFLYENELSCVWTFSANSGERIDLQFLSLNEDSSADNITVDDGSEILPEISERSLYTSVTGILTVRFDSDPSNVRTKFQAAIYTVVCGFNTTASSHSQTLTSPNYPNHYFNNLNCEWIITAGSGLFVLITIEDFNTEDNHDQLEIQNAYPEFSVTLSGNMNPGVNFQSQNQTLILTFISDGSVTGRGFNITYTETDTRIEPTTNSNAVVCGFNTTASSHSQTLTSPNYPNHYFNNLNCEWIITAGSGLFVLITIEDFNTEDNHDQLEIQNIYPEFSVTLSGNVIPGVNFQSQNQTLILTFISDGSVTGHGFNITYTETEARIELATTSNDQCAFRLNATNTTQFFTSPEYPSSYPSNIDCSWTLTTQLTQRIQITFISLNTEIFFDSVVVKETTSGTQTLSGHQEGRQFISMLNQIIVCFSSDDSIEESGFEASYVEIDPMSVCEFHLNATNTSMTITSPGYPNQNYSNNLNCKWIITAQPSYHVMITFLGFDTEPSFDVVSIFRGDDRTIDLSGGSSIEGRSFISIYSTLIMMFVTDSSITRSGFLASVIETDEFIEVEPDPCGFTAIATPTSQPIRSPGYTTYSYASDLNCTWVLTASPGFHVLFEISDFDTENRYDVVTINEGSGRETELDGNPTSIQDFYSTNQTLIINFRSDSTIQRRGFEGNFSETNQVPEFEPPADEEPTTSNECLFNLVANDSIKFINSPGWPNSYSNNLRCLWIVSVPEGSRILFILLSIDTERSFDYIRVDFGNDEIIDFSGSILPSRTEYISVGNTLQIRFQTDGSVTRQGFSSSFTRTNEPAFLDQDCSNNLTLGSGISESQTFSTPGFPLRYDNSLSCRWYLTVTTGRFIRLTFDQFQTEEVFDFVEIRSNNQLIRRLNGSVLAETTIFSIDNQMLIEFHSDVSVTDTGFNATFFEVRSAQVPEENNKNQIYRRSDEDKFGYYVQANTTPYYLQSPVDYDGSFVEWIIVSETINYAVRYTILSFECGNCESGLTILNEHGIIDTLNKSTTRLTSYIELHYLRVWLLSSDTDIRFISFYQEFEYNKTEESFELTNSSLNEQNLQSSSFVCDNGENIRIDFFCDGSDDCSDGSDEISVDCDDCAENKVTCVTSGNRTCLTNRTYVCENQIQCLNIDHCDVGCVTHYRCRNNSCVPMSSLCDGILMDGCMEDQEWTNGPGFKCLREGNLCFFPQQLLTDLIQDCDDGQDLCYSVSQSFNDNVRQIIPISDRKLNRSRCFECLDQSIVIPVSRVCDGLVDCPDLSDECLCEGEVPSICNNIRLRGLEKGTEPRNWTLCEYGEVQCEAGNCIGRNKVCNSVVECGNNRDEGFSFCQGTLSCQFGLPLNAGQQCRCNSRYQAVSGTLCNNVFDCPEPDGQDFTWEKPPGFAADECLANCSKRLNPNCTDNMVVQLSSQNIILDIPCAVVMSKPPSGVPQRFPPIATRGSIDSTQVCDGIVDCTLDHSDENNCAVRGRYYCAAGNAVSIAVDRVCDGTEDCEDGSDEDMTRCTNRFYCTSLGGTKVSIPPQFVCDGNINCDDSSDELNCTSDGRFYCETSQSGPLFVTRDKLFDGVADCSDFSDECPTDPTLRQDDVFSSRFQLIANSILRVMVWIMGLLAVIGNIVVMIVEFHNLRRRSERENTAALRNNRVLVINLAISDFIMGVYLLMLGGVGVFYDGNFCAHRLTWLSSTTCSAMGVMVLVSSETSVITLVLLTPIRMYGIKRPFDSKSKPKTSYLLIVISLVWSITLLLSLFPLLSLVQSIFVSRAFIFNNPYFSNTLVSMDTAQDWVTQLMTYDPQFTNASNDVFGLINNARSWYELEAIVDRSSLSSPYFQPQQFLGYYSADSVCIPRLFVTTEDKSWPFTISIVLFNFISFLYVAFANIFIVYEAKKMVRLTNKLNRSAKMQKKIFRVIATDFCCWFPISVMALLSIVGVPISNTAYAVSAIILLPINSALNPIVYSNAIDFIIRKLRRNTNITSVSYKLSSFSTLSKQDTKVTTLNFPTADVSVKK